MSVLAGDVLTPMRWNRDLSRHWRRLDLDAVASTVAAAAGLAGEPLPYTHIDGRPAFPLIVIDECVAAARLRSHQGPILDRVRLRDYAACGFADAPPLAVRLTGLVTVEPMKYACRHLAGLRTWASTVAAVPSWRTVDDLDAAACDFYGYPVYASDGQTASPVKIGDQSVRPACRRPDAWGRLRDEQMFQLALVSGLVRS
jgi:hypothetical protein